MLPIIQAILIGVAVFLLPGYAILALFNPRMTIDPVERLSLALGLTLAVIPLSLYGMTLLGLSQTPNVITLILLSCAGITIWDLWRNVKAGGVETLKEYRFTILLFLVIFLAALVARLWGVAGLDYPLWTDSYHHTLIAQIIADTGQVPSSYEPYAPIHDFTYHFGFHAIVAWFNLLTGIPIPRSVVLVGQMINALVVPTTYVLAKRLWGKASIGLLAALILGLFSHMPAFFVNWGRYTQLTGQMLLPVVLCFYAFTLDQNKQPGRLIALTAIGAAGLFLTHNRISLFLLVLSGLYFIQKLWQERRVPNRWKSLLMKSLLIFTIAFLLDLSWIVNFTKVFGSQVADMVLDGYQIDRFGNYYAWGRQYLIEYGVRLELWILAGLGILLGAIRRDRNVLLLSLGSILLFTFSLTHVVGIPPLFSALIVFIWLYLPLGLLGAYLIDACIAWIQRRWPGMHLASRWIRLMTLLLLASITYAGVIKIRDITLPENGFVRAEDLTAIDWIRENTPEEALFYIATHFWTPVVAHGLDAGYWLPFLADRQTILPPQNYGSDGTQPYEDFINQRARELSQADTMESLHKVMLEYRVTHIYVGERPTHLSGEQFELCPQLFELQYHQENVWVYSVIQPGQ